jgi:hypothetical protein
MVIGQPGDDDPETFTCRICGETYSQNEVMDDGNPRLSGREPVTRAGIATCWTCNTQLGTAQGRVRARACRRLGITIDQGWESWRAWGSEAERTAEIRRQEQVDAGLAEQPAEGEQNEGIPLPDTLPSGNSGGSQTSENDGYVYIVTHEEHEGWVSIGKTRAPTGRLGGYNRADPYRRYVMRHTVYVEDRHISESEAHAAAAAHETCEDSRGEWFQMPLESALEILNQIGTPPANDD